MSLAAVLTGTMPAAWLGPARRRGATGESAQALRRSPRQTRRVLASASASTCWPMPQAEASRSAQAAVSRARQAGRAPRRALRPSPAQRLVGQSEDGLRPALPALAKVREQLQPRAPRACCTGRRRPGAGRPRRLRVSTRCCGPCRRAVGRLRQRNCGDGMAQREGRTQVAQCESSW